MAPRREVRNEDAEPGRNHSRSRHSSRRPRWSSTARPGRHRRRRSPRPARRPAAASARSTAPITVPLRFDRYYNYEQVGEALRALHAAYPQLTTIDVVGKSEEGRDIWAMTVNNPKTGAALDKPGVYVDGNIHGNEIQAGEVCLAVLNRLLTGYGQNEQITKLVDRNAYYVIPVVNVDGRYHFFNDPNDPDSGRSIRIPKDDDRDGLFDEDGPDDLDGDGNICMMRRKDPFGMYKTDPEDPRLMIRVKPGEKGEWTLLGEEGIDNDGDGKVNEDGEGYVDGNRNWGINWAPPYVQSGAGDYPFEASGMRAIAKFLMDRPNIIVVFAYHNNGGMYLRGPSTKAGEPMNASDVGVYDILGKNFEKIVPGYRLPGVVEGPLPDVRRLHRLHRQRAWGPTASSANCSSASPKPTGRRPSRARRPRRRPTSWT